jgi:hypothetical protein
MKFVPAFELLPFLIPLTGIFFSHIYVTEQESVQTSFLQ